MWLLGTIVEEGAAPTAGTQKREGVDEAQVKRVAARVVTCALSDRAAAASCNVSFVSRRPVFARDSPALR